MSLFIPSMGCAISGDYPPLGIVGFAFYKKNNFPPIVVTVINVADKVVRSACGMIRLSWFITSNIDKDLPNESSALEYAFNAVSCTSAATGLLCLMSDYLPNVILNLRYTIQITKSILKKQSFVSVDGSCKWAHPRYVATGRKEQIVALINKILSCIVSIIDAVFSVLRVLSCSYKISDIISAKSVLVINKINSSMLAARYLLSAVAEALELWMEVKFLGRVSTRITAGDFSGLETARRAFLFARAERRERITTCVIKILESIFWFLSEVVSLMYTHSIVINVVSASFSVIGCLFSIIKVLRITSATKY